jgi:antitoxin ParD1/3/4
MIQSSLSRKKVRAMGKIEVTLNDETAEIVRQAVDSGAYDSVDDVIGGALIEWHLQRLSPEEALELRRFVQEGIDSGDAIDGPKALEEIRDHLRTLGAERDAK